MSARYVHQLRSVHHIQLQLSRGSWCHGWTFITSAPFITSGSISATPWQQPQSQQKSRTFCSPFNKDMWKKASADRNCPKQQKSVEFLLMWSQFSSSGRLESTPLATTKDNPLVAKCMATLQLNSAQSTLSPNLVGPHPPRSSSIEWDSIHTLRLPNRLKMQCHVKP